MVTDPAQHDPGLQADAGWFGLDRTGQYGFFTGVGAAVPLPVRAVMAAHDALRATISVPGVRSPEFPRSYARVGLFVYEWSTEDGRYRRTATPNGAVPSTLRAELSHSKDVPVLALDDFRESESVDSAAWLRTRAASPSRDAGRHDVCPRCRTRFPIRSAIVEESATEPHLSAVHDVAVILQCPKCRHRFRARDTSLSALLQAPHVRTALMLVALAALTSFYLWYW